MVSRPWTSPSVRPSTDTGVRIHLLSVGKRMPGWVREGYGEYAKRMPGECALKLVEITPGHRGKSADVNRAIREEGERMLKAIPRNCRVIALDVLGKSWSTEQLSGQMDEWMNDGSDVALLVGGPEGLAAEALQRSDGRWSLSPLTLPHELARVVVAEQLYRSLTLLRGLPYHK